MAIMMCDSSSSTVKRSYLSWYRAKQYSAKLSNKISQFFTVHYLPWIFVRGTFVKASFSRSIFDGARSKDKLS